LEEAPYEGSKGDFLTQFGINGKKDWTGSTITNPDTPFKEILTTFEDKGQKTMIIKDSKNRDNDMYRTPDGEPNDPRMLRWSEMVMDNWRQVASDAVGDLKFMVRDNIGTTETQDAINAAITRVTAGGKGDANAMQTFRRTAEGDELAGYQLIAGTVHGERVLKMLKDYHGELGNLKIDAFHVFRPGTTGGPSGQYSIVIEFGL